MHFFQVFKIGSFTCPKFEITCFVYQNLFHDNNCEVGIDSSSVYIKDKQMGTTLLRDSSDGGIYTR